VLLLNNDGTTQPDVLPAARRLPRARRSGGDTKIVYRPSPPDLVGGREMPGGRG
jgi:hypothetical protein